MSQETENSVQTLDKVQDVSINDIQLEQDAVEVELEQGAEVNEQESAVVEDKFNPEDIEFEEEYKIGDYDLSKFKDDINFSDNNVMETLSKVAGELKEKNFTQEQIEWLLEREIATAREKKEFQELKPDEVKTNLNKSLSLEEKRNYKAVVNFTKTIIGDDKELSGAFNEIVSNPYVVKLLNKAYVHNMGGKSINDMKTQVEEKQKGISSNLAINKLNEAIKYGKATKDFINDLRSQTLDKENLDVFLKAINKI